MTVLDEPSDGTDGEPGAGDGPRGVVLLVEDNETDRHLYGRLLWYNGYNVLYAPDGEEAVALALERRPDLILLDVMLPGPLSGIDVARRLRAEGLEMPMIILSAVSRDELRQEVDEAGITDYLEKPLDPFAVVREVLRHLGTEPPAAPDPGT